jgi:hypothetical protein
VRVRCIASLGEKSTQFAIRRYSRQALKGTGESGLDKTILLEKRRWNSDYAITIEMNLMRR